MHPKASRPRFPRPARNSSTPKGDRTSNDPDDDAWLFTTWRSSVDRNANGNGPPKFRVGLALTGGVGLRPAGIYSASIRLTSAEIRAPSWASWLWAVEAKRAAADVTKVLLVIIHTSASETFIYQSHTPSIKRMLDRKASWM